MEINSLEELKTKMETMECTVEWKVTSDIGPGWIGSSRELIFRLDDFILSETEFLKSVREKLIDEIPIPEKGGDHIIEGEGFFRLHGSELHLEYAWSATIPYGYPDETEKGRIRIA